LLQCIMGCLEVQVLALVPLREGQGLRKVKVHCLHTHTLAHTDSSTQSMWSD